MPDGPVAKKRKHDVVGRVRPRSLITTQRLPKVGWVTREMLVDLYIAKGMSVSQVAQHLGTCSTTVRNYMDRAGIERRAGICTPKTIIDDDCLRQMYCEQMLTHREIAAKLGCPVSCVQKRLAKLEIKPWHRRPEDRQKISNQSAEMSA